VKTHRILEFISDLDGCRTVEEVAHSLEKLLEEFGFDFYGVLKQPKPDENPMQLVLIGRWPERWPQTYIAKKYVLIDPTIRFLGLAQRAFRWRDTLTAFRLDPHRPRMERMMMEAVRNGLEDGYMFPVHGRNGLIGNVSLGGRAVDLSPVELSVLDAAARRVFWRLMEITGKARDLETADKVETKLTRREMEVLNYLAEGLTSHQISKVLKISNHTVDWYMNGIQDKLNAKNRQHVVALAFRQGLIT